MTDRFEYTIHDKTTSHIHHATSSGSAGRGAGDNTSDGSREGYGVIRCTGELAEQQKTVNESL